MNIHVWITEWLLSGMRLTLPLLFAAFGGMLSERSGVANIALEAYLLASSFGAAACMAVTHSWTLSMAAAFGGSAIIALLLILFSLVLKADQIVVGMALNLLATGLIPVLSNTLFDVSGQTPTLDPPQRFESLTFFFVAAAVVVLFAHWYFSRSRLGLRVQAAGDNPQALRSQGISVFRTRSLSILLGSAFATLGGIYLSIGVGSGYTRNMSAGRGYIALAALIFGRWKPWPTLLGCLLFGLCDALQILLQSVPLLPGGRVLPTQFVQALPYVVTLLLLAGFVGPVRAPAAINRPD